MFTGLHKLMYYNRITIADMLSTVYSYNVTAYLSWVMLYRTTINKQYNV